MSGQPHVCVERVRWADVDLVGIARFSAFTRYVEMGEQEWMRAAGLPYTDVFSAPDSWMPRRHLSIEYLSPARLDEALALVTYVSRIGESSMTINVDVLALADGSRKALAEMVVVCVDSVQFAKRALPAMLRTAVAPYVMNRDEALAAAIAPCDALRASGDYL